MSVNVIVEAIASVKGWAIKALGQSVGWIMRRQYPAERLAGLITIDVATQHDGLQFNAGELGDATLNLVVDNRSLFAMTLDRLIVKVYYAGHSTTCSLALPVQLPASTRTDVRLEARLGDAERRHIQGERRQEVEHLRQHGIGSRWDVSISADGHIKCAIRDFTLRHPQIRTRNVIFLNCGALSSGA